MKILFVCNQSMDRSPTAELLFSKKYDTKSAGVYSEEKPVTKELLRWSDIVLVMESHQRRWIGENFPREYLSKKILNLKIPDIYDYGQDELKEELIIKVNRVL